MRNSRVSLLRLWTNAITLADKFPPEVPAGITAVVGVNTIELEWERSTESDFKGYNVFRSVDGAPFEKVASLLEAPTYSDTNVQPGKTYRYAVSAVDLLNNESERSAAVQASFALRDGGSEANGAASSGVRPPTLL